MSVSTVKNWPARIRSDCIQLYNYMTYPIWFIQLFFYFLRLLLAQSQFLPLSEPLRAQVVWKHFRKWSCYVSAAFVQLLSWIHWAPSVQVWTLPCWSQAQRIPLCRTCLGLSDNFAKQQEPCHALRGLCRGKENQPIWVWAGLAGNVPGEFKSFTSMTPVHEKLRMDLGVNFSVFHFNTQHDFWWLYFSLSSHPAPCQPVCTPLTPLL